MHMEFQGMGGTLFCDGGYKLQNTDTYYWNGLLNVFRLQL